MQRQKCFRVVLVDDDDDVRDLARRHLERSARFSVVAEVATGASAVTAAAQHRPDVTLLDLNMPGTDGLTALPRIREAAPDCTVVVLSGLQRPGAEDEAIAAGAAGFLRKQPSWRQLPVDLLGLLEDGLVAHDATIELPGSLTSGREARRFLRRFLRRWGVPDLVHDAQLLTSELVNNAVVHASSAVTVRVRFKDRCLRVEVADVGAGALRRPHSGPEDTGGRGLHLVEVLSTSWGTSSGQTGRVVWFELDGSPAPAQVARRSRLHPLRAPLWD